MPRTLQEPCYQHVLLIPLATALLLALPQDTGAAPGAQRASSPPSRRAGQRERGPSGHAERVTGLAFAPSASLLASSGDTEVRLWEVPGMRLARRLEAGRDNVVCLSWSADGQMLAGGSLDRYTYVWEARTGRRLLTLGPAPDQVLHVAFAPQAEQVACASYNGVVTVFDLVSGRAVQRLQGHCAVYSPDGRELATAGIDGRIHRYSSASGKELASMKAHTRCPQDLCYSPDGALLASCADSVRLWRGASLQAELPSQRHGAILTQVRWSSDGRTLLAASFLGEGQAWRRADGGSWRPQPLLSGNPIQAVATSRDGSYLALGNLFGDVMLASMTGWRSLAVAPGRAGRTRSLRGVPGQPQRVQTR